MNLSVLVSGRSLPSATWAAAPLPRPRVPPPHPSRSGRCPSSPSGIRWRARTAADGRLSPSPCPRRSLPLPSLLQCRRPSGGVGVNPSPPRPDPASPRPDRAPPRLVRPDRPAADQPRVGAANRPAVLRGGGLLDGGGRSGSPPLGSVTRTVAPFLDARRSRTGEGVWRRWVHLGISSLDPPAATPYCPLLGAGGAPAMRTRAGVASCRGHFPGGDWGVDLDSRAPDGDGGVGTGHLDKPANPPSHAVVAWINCTKHSA